MQIEVSSAQLLIGGGVIGLENIDDLPPLSLEGFDLIRRQLWQKKGEGISYLLRKHRLGK